MKKLVYLFIAIFMGAHSTYAQDCATGYCPSTITVHHKAGNLSAAGGDITYQVVKITVTAATTCWIAQNLGAASAPTTYGTYAGWVYQAGHAQAYLAGTTTVNSSPTIGTAWQSSEDPCTLTFGSPWHIPTSVEYKAASTSSWAAAGYVSFNYDAPLYSYNTGTAVAYDNTNNHMWYYVSDLGTSGTTSNTIVNAGGINTNFQLTTGYLSGTTQLWVTLPVRCVKTM